MLCLHINGTLFPVGFLFFMERGSDFFCYSFFQCWNSDELRFSPIFKTDLVIKVFNPPNILFCLLRHDDASTNAYFK